MSWAETISQIAIGIVTLIQISKLFWVNPKAKKKLDDIEKEITNKLPQVVQLAQQLQDLKNTLETLKAQK